MSVVLFMPSAQQYADLSAGNVDVNYGTVTSLTPIGVTVTSNGYRGDSDRYTNRHAAVLGNVVIFFASDDTHGDELWVTDGTRAGTSLLLDIEPGVAGSSPANLRVVGDKAYFAASTTATGTELWVTDGTTAGTSQLIDLYDGVESSNPNSITAFKNGFLFAAIDENSADYGDGIVRQQVWFSDGTVEGTSRLSANDQFGVVPKTTGLDARSDLSPFQLIGDTLAVFGGTTDRVKDGGVIGQEIWVTNGAPEPWGTRLLVDVNDETDNSNIQWIYTANEKQVIVRSKTAGKWDNDPNTTGTLDNEYWVTDGSPKGTYLLQDLNTNPGAVAGTTQNTGSAHPFNFDNKIFYRAGAGVGNELYKMTGLSGSGNELGLAYDMAPLDAVGVERSSFLDDPIAFDEKLFMKVNFRSENGPGGQRWDQELALYDPTDETVKIVADIFPGANSFPRNKTIVNGRMYFTGNTGSYGSDYNIWALDINGVGEDPAVPAVDNLSKIARYTIYKVYEDVDGLNNQLQSDLLNLNETLIFATIDNTLAVFDDGLTKVTEPYTDPKAVGPPVNIGSNDKLNAPPVVSLSVADVDNIFVEGDEVVLNVNAIDPEAVGISKVEYYFGTGDFSFSSWSLEGTATEGDYSLRWTAVASANPYTITALAYDDNDSTYSMPVQILVNGNQPPSVALTLPTADIVVEPGAVVPIAADASDDNAAGFVSVTFIAGSDTLSIDSVAPYGLEWTAPQTEGITTIKAVATDNLGATTESNVVTVEVERPLGINTTEQLLIYPVPSDNGVLHLDSKFPNEVEVYVQDMQGRTVYQGSKSPGKSDIDLSGVSKGLYLLKLNSNNEDFVYKIILE